MSAYVVDDITINTVVNWLSRERAQFSLMPGILRKLKGLGFTDP
jgi:hypothetical protein